MMSRVKGFSLLELVVCIGVLALLVAVLAPAVIFTRESARRISCVNNAKQIGLAMQNYENFNRKIPPAMVWARSGEPFGGGVLPIGVIDHTFFGATDDPLRSNWLVFLLPFIDGDIDSRGAYDVSLSSPVNSGLRMRRIVTFQCPSDSFGDRDFERGFSSAINKQFYARGNYAMNLGPNTPCLTFIHDCRYGFTVDSNDLRNRVHRLYGDGVGGFNVAFALSQFPNGLSNIVAVDEIRSGLTSDDPRGVWSLGFIGSSLTGAHPGRPNSIAGDGLAACGGLISQFGESSLRKQGMPCQNPHSIANWAAVARSKHKGLVNVLRLDGSVSSVADLVDSKVWLRSHCRTYEVADFLSSTDF